MTHGSPDRTSCHYGVIFGRGSGKYAATTRSLRIEGISYARWLLSETPRSKVKRSQATFCCVQGLGE